MQKLGHMTLLVREYEEALDFYVNILGFEKKTDNAFGEGMRWVTIAPEGQPDVEIVLMKPMNPDQEARVGSQVGDHILWTLQTDDCQRDYKALKEKGVNFLGEPSEQFYGTEVIFEDLYGNRWDLIELK